MLFLAILPQGPLGAFPRGPWVPSPTHKPLLLWAELKKVVAQQPGELKTMAKVFPNWEAASRWSQALEKVENSSRPYLKEVQRYEKYRCWRPMGMGWSRQPSLLATGARFQPPSTPCCTKPLSASF